MDLQTVIGSGPSDAGTQKLGHTGLKIAAVAVVFFPCAEIGQLSGDHDLDRHHRQFVGNAGEVDQGFAELLAVLGVLHRYVQSRLGHTNCAGRCLDAGGFKSLHQLLEAFTFFAAQQIFTFDVEVIKAKLVFFHTAVTQHFDFAAGHPFGGEGGFVGARGLFGQEHRQTAIVGCVGVSARQKGHHMGAGRVSDPCLVAGHFVIAVLVFDGAGAQAAKVGAGVRFGEDGCWQDFSAGDFRQPVGFLLVRAASDDQLGCDFRAGAQ